MFTDNPNLIKLGDKAYVYKNFIDKDTVEKINNFYDGQSREKFNYHEHEIDWYSNKTSKSSVELVPVYNKVNEFLSPDYVTPPNLYVLIMEPGDEPMFIHADSPGEHGHENVVGDDAWGTCPLVSWGVVVYFGNWEGGEIFYPQFDLEYLPEPGDMIIHSAFSPWEHGVKPVTKGKRYAYSLFALETHKNPGSFYNYGTEECKIAQEDPYSWSSPLI